MVLAHISQNTLMQIFYLIMSTCGLIWQIHQISSVYFEYQTQVDIDIEAPHNITMPALTFCLEILRDEKILRSFYPDNETIPDLRYIPINILSHLPTADAKIICKTPFPELKKINPDGGEFCKNYAEPVITVHYNPFDNVFYQCTTYFFRNSSQPPFHVISANDKDFYKVDIYSSSNTSVLAFIHNPTEILHQSESDSFHFTTGSVSEMILCSTKIIRKLLPAPYRTNCYNYDDVYFGRMGCIFNCRRKQASEKCEIWPWSVPAEPWVNSVFTRSDGEDDCNQPTKYDCSSKSICQPQCYNLWYTTTLISTQEKDDQFNLTKFFVRRPFGVELVYTYLPKLAEIEYLCYIASCCGIWLGVSFYDLIYIVIKFFNQRFLKNNASNQQPMLVTRPALIAGKGKISMSSLRSA